VTQSINPNRRAEWRGKAIAAAGYDPRRDFTSESFSRWWFNGINPTSLRLSRAGAKWFDENAKFQFYCIKLRSPITGKQMLQLEKLFDAPYYLATKTIYMLDEANYIMLQLNAGNLAQYLDNLEDNQ
jgi:hypothetical protein